MKSRRPTSLTKQEAVLPAKTQNSGLNKIGSCATRKKTGGNLSQDTTWRFLQESPQETPSPAPRFGSKACSSKQTGAKAAIRNPLTGAEAVQPTNRFVSRRVRWHIQHKGKLWKQLMAFLTACCIISCQCDCLPETFEAEADDTTDWTDGMQWTLALMCWAPYALEAAHKYPWLHINNCNFITTMSLVYHQRTCHFGSLLHKLHSASVSVPQQSHLPTTGACHWA